MNKQGFYIVNGLTLYRLLAGPVLLYFIFTDNINVFKWLLPISFFTDMLDGFLARKLNVSTVVGAKLDSIADDITIVVAIIGAFVFKPEFIKQELMIILILLALFIIQMVLSFIRYRNFSSFHTYLAKLAALMQGMFLILLFILDTPSYFLFVSAAIVTMLDLIEEIIIVLLLPTAQTNVKGLYWVMKNKK
jgi:phosphatidylglycerophosphate synthase